MPLPLLGAYIFAAVIVAILGRKQKFGFWGYFFLSLLITPILSFILLVVSSINSMKS